MIQGSIVKKILDTKEKAIQNYPIHTNRASSIGHPCLRYLVLCRRDWTQIPLINVALKLRFELGDVFEKKVVRDLMDADIELYEFQKAFHDPETNISGHLDGIIRDDKKSYPIEIKSASPLMFPRINSIEGMINSPYHYLQGYPYQLETYMMLGGYEKGVFLFVDKSTGAYKEIWQEASAERQHEIKQKSIEIDKHLKEGTTPECINYDANICGRCKLEHVCMPPRESGNVIINSDDPTLIEALNRREELAAAKKEYDKCDKYVKAQLKGKNGMIGDFYVTSKDVTRSEYTAQAGSYTKLTIKKL